MAKSFKPILDKITEAVNEFQISLPKSESDMASAVLEEIMKLDVKDGRIKQTVANLKIAASIKNKILQTVLTERYLKNVKKYMQAFNDVTDLQNEYWSSVDDKFKPTSILREIKIQTVNDTVAKLTEAGIDTNVGRPVADILNQNITTGGSMKELMTGVKDTMTTTESGAGMLNGYAGQVATDAINQYSRNYTQVVSSDLGIEWYGYRNTLITTSREFCIAMHERRYFHVSEIPALLKATGLYYKDQKSGKVKKVRINPKTDLPYGMYNTTNAGNFLTVLGGYNCGHQATPVSERLVKMQDPGLYEKIINTPAYKRWKKAQE